MATRLNNRQQSNKMRKRKVSGMILIAKFSHFCALPSLTRRAKKLTNMFASLKLQRTFILLLQDFEKFPIIFVCESKNNQYQRFFYHAKTKKLFPFSSRNRTTKILLLLLV
jgi:hypothetical protein